jgi:chromatin remodeling complex protein RSC6
MDQVARRVIDVCQPSILTIRWIDKAIGVLFRYSRGPLYGVTMCRAENGGVMPKKKTNSAFLKMAQAPLKPSPQLAEVLGSSAPISRPQVAKKVWAYIKKHKLQDPKKRREIVADEKLKPVFGKARLDMFQMTKAISKHLSK